MEYLIVSKYLPIIFLLITKGKIVTADTVSFRLLTKDFGSLDMCRARALDHHLAPDLALATGAARLGLCAGSCVHV